MARKGTKYKVKTEFDRFDLVELLRQFSSRPKADTDKEALAYLKERR